MLCCEWQCAECENFDLCADCFCAGVELKPHKNTHAYRVSDNLNFPVFDKDWTAKEELLLLDGMRVVIGVCRFCVVVGDFWTVH